MKGKGKKAPSSPVAALRKIGIIERQLSPVQRAGKYWRGAYHMMPRVGWWINISCAIALLGALACLVIVFTRPRPVLLVSFPDGTTVCSLPPLDPSTGRPVPRPDEEELLCRRLAIQSGRGGDELNEQFAKEKQLEQEEVAIAPQPAPAPVQASPLPPADPATQGVLPGTSTDPIQGIDPSALESGTPSAPAPSDSVAPSPTETQPASVSGGVL